MIFNIFVSQIRSSQLFPICQRTFAVLDDSFIQNFGLSLHSTIKTTQSYDPDSNRLFHYYQRKASFKHQMSFQIKHPRHLENVLRFLDMCCPQITCHSSARKACFE